jgi:hypothetical protein
MSQHEVPRAKERRRKLVKTDILRREEGFPALGERRELVRLIRTEGRESWQRVRFVRTESGEVSLVFLSKLTGFENEDGQVGEVCAFLSYAWVRAL